ncbi:MAG: hypothetical protein OEP95_11955 [Myxococcales bacterium]|nr:hypothetical protein [Myxococcales bacterium]
MSIRFATVALGILVGAISPLAGPAARAELLPLFCDDSVGASAFLGYVDSSPELEEQDETTECGTAPVGTWAVVSYDDDTSAATVSARAEALSADGRVLEAINDLDLEVDDGIFDFASVGVALGVEGRFEAPDSDDPVDAELIVEIIRSGGLEDTVLALLVEGPGVDVREDLDDEPAGELRFPVELEAGEEYRAILTADAALTETGQGAQALRFSVDVEPVPEPAAAWLLVAGTFGLAASRLGRRRVAG